MQKTQLRTTQLGETGLRITRVGFGAWAIGGDGYQFGWGTQDDDDSIAAIHRALELGINWIDTAAVYGLGRSERVVGRALEGVDDRPYVFTKASLVEEGAGRVGHSLKRASIRREVEASLDRLRVEAIDLYQIHWPIPDKDIEEGWSTFAELKAKGSSATSASRISTWSSCAGSSRSHRSRRCSHRTRSSRATSSTSSCPMRSVYGSA